MNTNTLYRYGQKPTSLFANPTLFFQSNPLTFLKHNILTIGNLASDTPLNAGIYSFVLTKVQDCQGLRHCGNLANCYKLTWCKHSEFGIKAYFLPFKARQVSAMLLGHEANFFFTHSLTGCGFGVKQQPEPEVMHFDGDSFNRGSMRKRLPEGLLFTDLEYQDVEHYSSAQVLGIRQAQQWQFYSQIWEMKGLDTYRQSIPAGVQTLTRAIYA